MIYVPFPHLVIDNFLPESLAYAVVREFPTGTPPINWHKRHHLHSRKWTLESLGQSKHQWGPAQWKPAAWEAFEHHLYAPAFIARMEKEFGIAPLSPDLSLKGGGMHLSTLGSYLDIHADFEVHSELAKRRALNALLYLTPEYDPGDGGELELWSADMRRCAVSYLPLFNRVVVFATSKTSFHGHPEPYRGARRLSLAAYYYTHWQDNGERMRGLMTTDYRPRPWEYGKKLRKWVGRQYRAYEHWRDKGRWGPGR